MKTEAAANADSDKKARERADKINTADSLIFQTEKQLKEFGDKVPEEKKGPIEAALNDLKEAHKTQDLDKIDSASEALNTAWQAASQEIYQATQEAGGNPGGAGPEATADAGAEGAGASTGGNDAEDVTDVEYEEVDDKK